MSPPWVYMSPSSWIPLPASFPSHPSELSQRTGFECRVSCLELGLAICFTYGNMHVWRRQWHPTPVLLPGKSHGWRSLVGCSPWGSCESDTTERLHFYFSLSGIGEGNGNPLLCSCLENPRDGEPGGLPSMGLHRVGHDWRDLAAAAYTCICFQLLFHYILLQDIEYNFLMPYSRSLFLCFIYSSVYLLIPNS